MTPERRRAEEADDLDVRIHYQIYAQDGTLVEMVCKDTPSLRMFVKWLWWNDRYLGGADEYSVS